MERELSIADDAGGTAGGNAATRPVSAHRRAVNGLVAAVLGAALAYGILSYIVSTASYQTDLQDFALGPDTASHYATVDGVPVHCNDLSDAQKCIDGIAMRGYDSAVLWLGNSQLHGINQMKPGDKSAPERLTEMLGSDNQALVTFSEPNANLQEHLAILAYIAERQKLDGLILPVVFDDLRETGVRDELAGMLTDEQARELLSTVEIGRQIITSGSSPNATSHGEENLQAIVERWFEQTLSSLSEVWQARNDLRANSYVALYRIRNAALGINPSTIRRTIPGRYATNLAALNGILAIAQSRQIPVVVYVPPLRSDVPIPYAPSEYKRFKTQLRQTVQSSDGARLVDLEQAVPSEFWGMKAGTSLGVDKEVDFMHFQASGHQRLADALYPEITSVLAEEQR